MSMCCGVEARTGWDYSADGRKMPMVKSGWHGNRVAVYPGDKQGSKQVFTRLCNDGLCSYWVFIQQTLNRDWLMLRLCCGSDKRQDSWSMHSMTLKELCVSDHRLCTWMEPTLGKRRAEDDPPQNTAFLWMCEQMQLGEFDFQEEGRIPHCCDGDDPKSQCYICRMWFLSLLLILLLQRSSLGPPLRCNLPLLDPFSAPVYWQLWFVTSIRNNEPHRVSHIRSELTMFLGLA